MPGPTLPNTGVAIPALGGDSGSWDDELNTAWGNYDEHNHTPGKGLLVPVAGISIDADLPMGGHALNSLGKIAFSAVAPLAAGSKALYVSSVDGELYWRSAGGVNVKLTSVSALNTALVGGIVGDYTAAAAEVAYDDANDGYTFKQQAPFNWARIDCGGIRIHEFNTLEALYVGVKAPAALAASFDVTLPLAAPVSTSIVLMDSAGVFSATNTVPNAITFSTSIQTPTIAGTPNFTGAVTMATTLQVSGVTTLLSTLGVTGNVTAPDLRYTTAQTVSISAAEAQTSDPTVHVFSTTIPRWAIGVSVARLVFPMPVRAGDRITAWRLYVDNASVAGTVTARLFKTAINAGVATETALGTASTSSAAGLGPVALANTGLSIDVDNAGAHEQFYVVFTGGGTTGDLVYHAEVDLKRP